MGFVKRKWTAKEADEWSKEDTLTIILSPLIYMALMIGCALSAFLLPIGFIILAAGIILLVVMIYIINPKLSAVSEEYEKKQKEYLKTLDRKIKWEE